MSKLTILLTLILSASAWGSTPPVIESLAEFQKWSPLKSKAQGLLVAEKMAGFYSMGWMRQSFPDHTTSRRPQVYQFVTGTDSPVAVYFPSRGEGFNFLDNWSPGSSPKPYRRDVAMFSKDTHNSWGLNKEAHIVEAEVNGGHGSTGGIHFIASDVKVSELDRQIEPAKMIKKILGQYSDVNGVPTQQLRFHMVRSLAQAVQSEEKFGKVRSDNSPQQFTRSFRATWHPETKELKIVVYNRLFHTHIVRGQGGHPRRVLPATVAPTGLPGLPPVRDRMPPPPPHCDSTTMTEYGSEWARIYTVNEQGEISSGHVQRANYILPTRTYRQCRHPHPLPHPLPQPIPNPMPVPQS